MSKRLRPPFPMPHRTMKAMADFITTATKARRYHRPHPFCFNVKIYRVNFDFDHLLNIYRTRFLQDPEFTKSPEWLAQAKEKYEEVKDGLFEPAIEVARAYFVGFEGQEDLRADQCLWDGTPVEATFSFEGRSGGWLSINSFEGIDFTDDDIYPDGEHPVRDMLMRQSFRWLRKFYKFVAMLSHDLSGNKVEDEVEFQAAIGFFENACGDIPPADARQLKLPL